MNTRNEAKRFCVAWQRFADFALVGTFGGSCTSLCAAAAPGAASSAATASAVALRPLPVIL